MHAQQWVDALIDTGQLDAAEATIRNLLAAAEATHPTLRAELLRIYGDVSIKRQQLHTALTTYEESLAITRRLGEDASTWHLLDRIADAQASLGRRPEAWQLRIESFLRQSRSGRFDMAWSLDAAARSEASADQTDTAFALVALTTDFRPQGMWDWGFARGYTDASLWRALAAQRTGRTIGHDIVKIAAQTADSLGHPEIQSRARLDGKLIDALILLQRRDARRALSLVNLYFAEAVPKRHRYLFPEAHFIRALAFRATGDDQHAEKDLRRAMWFIAFRRADPIEQQSASFFSREEITAELVDLLVKRGDADAAFAVLGEGRRQPYRPRWSVARERDKDLLIAEYVVLRDRLLVFIAKSDQVSVHTVAVDNQTLRATANAFAKEVAGGTGSSAGDELSRWLIAPLSEHLSQSELLVIVPDPALSRVPFVALRTNTRRYLLEEIAVVFAPANSLAARPRPITPGTTLVVGDPQSIFKHPPLPYARVEAKEVASRYDHSKLLLGADATYSAVLNEAMRATVIHFATHAVVPSDQTLGSLLVLAPETNASGALNTKTLSVSLLSRTPLVVLAGCRTGATPNASTHAGTLALAFVASGASSVVGTLWDLPDDALSMDVSLRLHDELQRGVNPAHALRTAQLAMLYSSDAARQGAARWSTFQLWSTTPESFLSLRSPHKNSVIQCSA